MNLTPAQNRLTKSVDGIITRADHRVFQRINKETRQPSDKDGHTSWVLEDARIAGECIDEALPLLFTAYNAERSRLWFNTSSLNFLVRQGVDRFYDGMARLQIYGVGEVVADRMRSGILNRALEERKLLTMDAVEEHFRHPGIGSPLQRHPIAALLATNFITFLVTITGRALVP